MDSFHAFESDENLADPPVLLQEIGVHEIGLEIERPFGEEREQQLLRRAACSPVSVHRRACSRRARRVLRVELESVGERRRRCRMSSSSICIPRHEEQTLDRRFGRRETLGHLHPPLSLIVVEEGLGDREERTEIGAGKSTRRVDNQLPLRRARPSPRRAVESCPR